MHTKIELILSIILVVLAALFLDPLMVLMPPELLYMAMGGLVIAFAVFAGYIWRERPADERDEYHRLFAGRVGYLLGSGILIIALVWQTVTAHPDPWLVAALVGMILGKFIGLYYGRTRR